MKCQTCGTEMVPMIMSSFCPRDCDREAPTVPVSDDAEIIVEFLPNEAYHHDSHTRWTKRNLPGYYTLVLFDSVDGMDHWVTPHVRGLSTNARAHDRR